MDYQFTRTISGRPTASFEPDHQLIGLWLTDELANNLTKLNELMVQIKHLEAGMTTEFSHHGAELGIHLDREEVEVFLMSANAEADIELPEGTDLDEQSEKAGCGLADFKHLLLSWRQFIST